MCTSHLTGETCYQVALTDIVPDSTFASSAPSSSVPIIAHEFHVGREVGNLITTLFLVGFMLGPTLWGPGSELVGRRPIFVCTLAMYTIFHIGQACANNMTTLLVTRFLCGFSLARLESRRRHVDTIFLQYYD